MNRTTHLIDAFEKAGDVQTPGDVTEEDTILVLQKDEETEVKPLDCKNATKIVCKSRLDGFYQAKRLVDCELATKLIIHTRSMATFWFTVCSQLLTAAYNWKISTTGAEEPKYDDQLIPEIREFIRSYKAQDDVKILTSNLIGEKFVHGFSTRKGGLSTAKGVSSMNMVSGSNKRDTELIEKENTRRLGLKAGFDPNGFVRARAVHGNTVYVVGKDAPANGYDSVVSNKRGITVAAPGADCLMVVFADEENLAFGACHSGWKGTLAKVCIETIKTMEAEFGTKKENVKVVFGPSIGTCCLEFGEKDSELFKSISEKCVIKKDGSPKPFIDLCLANRVMLESHGVLPSNIDDGSLKICTTCNPELLYSYRRDGIPFGNQVGFIGLK